MLLQSLMNLKKQLSKELKAQAGAGKVITAYSITKNKSHLRVLSDAQQKHIESKNKVEVLSMKIMKIKEVLNALSSPDRTLQSLMSSDSGVASFDGHSSFCGIDFCPQFTQLQEDRMDVIRYKIHVETRLMQGAQSLMRVNTNNRKSWLIVSFDNEQEWLRYFVMLNDNAMINNDLHIHAQILPIFIFDL